MSRFDLETYLGERKELVDRYLEAYLPGEDRYPPKLFKAMKHTLFAGGKRLRPILLLASVEAVGKEIQDLIPFACALELIHTYSLIHDDLPSMDDDDYRRGLPSSHKVFGEAIAILTGDALLTEAFCLMSTKAVTNGLDPLVVLGVIHEITEAIGASGMVAGQAADILAEGEAVGISDLEYIHNHKTGAFIRVTVRTGALLARASQQQLESLSHYGRALGLAFQIRDDILNVEGNSKKLGKSVGSDLSRKKVTYPSILGLEKSKKAMRDLVEESIKRLTPFNHQADPLREIARYLIARTC